MTRSSVDLPQPDGPMSETSSPGRMSRSTASSATIRPAWPAKTLSTPRTLTMGGGSAGPAVTRCRPRRGALVLRDAEPRG